MRHFKLQFLSLYTVFSSETESVLWEFPLLGCMVRLEVAGDKWAIAILNVLIPDGWGCCAMSKVCRVVGLAGFMLLSGIEMTIITLSNVVIATDAPHHDIRVPHPDLLSLCWQMNLDLTVLTFPVASTRDAPCCGPPGNFCFLRGKIFMAERL